MNTKRTPSDKPRVSAKKAGDTQPQAQAAPEQEPVAAPSGERKIEGKRLIACIKKTLMDRNLPERHIADIMGVTTIYWNSMTNGHRKIKSLGKDKLAKVAEFLGLPTIQVFQMADYFSPEDFFITSDLDDQLFLGLKKMREDPNWISMAPTDEDWEKTPLRVRLALVTLYERESSRAILRRARIEIPDAKIPS